MRIVVTVDGALGPLTIVATTQAMAAAPDYLADAYGIARRNYYYRLADGRAAVDDFEIDRRVIALETRNAVDEVHRTNVGVRLAAIEETLCRLVRLIIGGLLMAGLTYAVQVGLMI